MNNELLNLLRKRRLAGQCIICGREISDKSIVISHSELGEVRICEEDIKTGSKSSG